MLNKRSRYHFIPESRTQPWGHGGEQRNAGAALGGSSPSGEVIDPDAGPLGVEREGGEGGRRGVRVMGSVSLGPRDRVRALAVFR